MSEPNKIIPWLDIFLALLALIPITIAEVVRSCTGLFVIWLIYLIGVIVSRGRGRSLWFFWWLGWLLFTTILAITLLIPAINNELTAFSVWWFLLLSIFLFIILTLWQPGENLLVAFTMLPWSLEFSRFIFFNNLPSDEFRAFLFVRAAATLIYIGVIVVVLRLQTGWKGWLVLGLGALVYFSVIVFASWPIAISLFIYPIYLPVITMFVFAPIIGGSTLDAHRGRHRLPKSVYITSMTIVALIPLTLLLPWLLGNNSPIPAAQHTPLTTQIAETRQPVIVDTDMSYDDLIALLYLLQRPDIEVVGITVVDGVAHAEYGLENLRRLLALARREDIPVARGPDKPLIGNNTFPEARRPILDLGFRLGLPQATAELPTLSASELLQQLISSSPSTIQLIALGPLTNIALALQDDPTFIDRLNSVVVGGGAIYVPGNIYEEYPIIPNTVAEWNLWMDPHASALVFQSGVPLVVVPLDVTHIHGSSPLLITRNLMNEFSEGNRWRETQFMLSIMAGLFLANPDANAQPLWDAVTVAVAVDPTICTDWRDMPLRIATGPPEIAGQTVIVKDGEPNARVCLAGDQAAFERSYLQLVYH